MKPTDDTIDLRNRIVRAVRSATGMHEPLAVPIADEILWSLCRDLGGAEVYIPSATRRLMKERNRRIRDAFNGRNHDEVCRLFGISRATLYRALKEE